MGNTGSTPSTCVAADLSQVVTYYGQGYNQPRLSTFCAESALDIINIGFVNLFPDSPEALEDYPGSNFGNQCGASVYTVNGEPTKLFSDCHQIVEDIPLCQTAGKKVFLSFGGGYPADGQVIANDTSGEEFADFIWGAFGPPTDAWTKAGNPRPFDDIVFDGFDFDIEYNGPTGVQAMITQLRSHFTAYEQQYPDSQFYLSAAPKCANPDPQLGPAIDAGLFDYLWVQFYNNPACAAANYAHNSSLFNFDVWVQTIQASQNQKTKLFVGLPAAPNEALQDIPYPPNYYYLPADEVQPLVTQYMTKYPDIFGGVMLWEATGSDENRDANGQTYAAQIKEIVVDAATSLCPAPTTTSSSSSTSTSSPSSAPVVPSSTPVVSPSSASVVPSSTPVVSPSSVPVVPSSTPVVSPSSVPVIPSSTPVVSPSSVPVIPSSTPVVSPSSVPVIPSSTPVVSPSSAPVVTRSTSTVAVPSSTPVVSPSSAPIVTPSSAPVVPSSTPVVSSPSSAPVVTPSSAPVTRPSSTPIVSSSSAPVSPSSSPCDTATSTVVTSSTTTTPSSSKATGTTSSMTSPVSGSSSTTAPVITSSASLTSTATSSAPETITTVVVTSYVDICPTGLTTITTTYTTTYCPGAATATVTTAPPAGWTTTVTVCTVCGPKPTTVTLTLPASPATVSATATATAGSGPGLGAGAGSGSGPSGVSPESASTPEVVVVTAVIVPQPSTLSVPLATGISTTLAVKPAKPSQQTSHTPVGPSSTQTGTSPIFTGAAASRASFTPLYCVFILVASLVALL